ncbi:MAG: hypothetical protein FD137_834 [Spirochaetes bacterium]|nr:MAG: hypothetical protein FD137_834 [Spirochaetota bacterium]
MKFGEKMFLGELDRINMRERIYRKDSLGATCGSWESSLSCRIDSWRTLYILRDIGINCLNDRKIRGF